MCKIDNETIFRANRKAMNRKDASYRPSSAYTGGEMVVSIRYNGVNYSERIKIKDVNTNFKRSLELSRSYGKKL